MFSSEILCAAGDRRSDIAVVGQGHFARPVISLPVAGKLRRNGVAVTTDIVIGENVASAIGDFASREKADLIAMATHGLGGLARLIRGSVADAVMHCRDCGCWCSGRSSRGNGKRVRGGVRADLIPA